MLGPSMGRLTRSGYSRLEGRRCSREQRKSHLIRLRVVRRAMLLCQLRQRRGGWHAGFHQLADNNSIVEKLKKDIPDSSTRKISANHPQLSNSHNVIVG